jgi:hypothetical protein
MGANSESEFLMNIDAVQSALGRSRPSLYRYANTDNDQINLAYDPKKLNPELRQNRNEPLLFHPTEVSRFARDVLKVQQVTIQVQESPVNATNQVLQQILAELQAIHAHLKNQ